MQTTSKLLLLIFLICPCALFSQVKIGDPTGAVHPTAVLELKDSARGLLLPRLSQTKMNSIAAPADGLLVYNTTLRNIYQFRADYNKWMPLRSDSSDWVFDSASAKLYLRYGLANGDSIYYNTAKKKFLFTDTRFYKLSNGIDAFNLDEGNSDKFVFKTTSSMFPRDPLNLNSANIYAIYEVDNDSIAIANPYEAAYTGIAVNNTVLPQATQKIGGLFGIQNLVTNVVADTINTINGLYNAVSQRGKGFVQGIAGFNNVVSIRDSTTSIGIVQGISNNITYTSPPGTPRILGDLYGYHNTFSAALNNKVDGFAYGINIRSVMAAAPGRNFAIVTAKGLNRFADSVLITDGFAPRPRAVLDVNATSAMIIPVGNTGQRPVLLYPGMLRYNTDISAPEAYTGVGGWISLKPSAPLAQTVILDPPALAPGTTGSYFVAFTGAAFGNTVTVAPDVALPNGIVIAWARVAGVGLVEVSFGNISSSPIDVVAQNFYVKVIQ